MSKLAKLQDNFNDRKSRADGYWDESDLKRFYRTFRPSMDLPKTFLSDNNSLERATEKYKLRGFQFGNWVTNEDRYEYLAALYICLYDLNKVLRFKSDNMGLSGSLGIALGARGVGAALAHFEPKNNVINMSRYKREDVFKKLLKDTGQRVPNTIPKAWRFQNTGGIGSFAHEYGHFLDLNFGLYIEPHKDYPFLSGTNKSVSRKRIEFDARQYPLRAMMEDILQAALVHNGSDSDFSLRLRKTESEYLNLRVEIWARIFEQYVQYKLAKTGVRNSFMTKTKYKAIYYLNDKELAKVIPLIDKLIDKMRQRT